MFNQKQNKIFKGSIFLLISMSLVIALLITCKKKQEQSNSSQNTVNTSQMQARFKTIATVEPGPNQKWLATISKGERVSVYSEEKTILVGNKDVTYVKVSLSGVGDGWMNKSHLTESMAVITKLEGGLKSRPSKMAPMSPTSNNAVLGSLVEVHKIEKVDDGEYAEISGYIFGQGFRGWISTNYLSFSDEDIIFSSQIEDAYYTLTNPKSTETQFGDASEKLDNIANAPYASDHILKYAQRVIELTSP